MHSSSQFLEYLGSQFQEYLAWIFRELGILGLTQDLNDIHFQASDFQQSCTKGFEASCCASYPYISEKTSISRSRHCWVKEVRSGDREVIWLLSFEDICNLVAADWMRDYHKVSYFVLWKKRKKQWETRVRKWHAKELICCLFKGGRGRVEQERSQWFDRQDMEKEGLFFDWRLKLCVSQYVAPFFRAPQNSANLLLLCVCQPDL